MLTGGMSTKCILPLRVGSKIAQSARGSLVGTNKLIGLNCKYVFPSLASLWDFTHAHTHTQLFHTRAHNTHITTTTYENHVTASRTFLFEVVVFKTRGSLNLGSE